MTLVIKNGLLPASEPLSSNLLTVTLYDRAGNTKTYTFVIEVV